MINKNAIKLILMKRSNIKNGPKQAPLCSAPALEFYPHVPIWSLLLQSLKHKSQRHSHNHMTGTASGSERDAVCQFAYMHLCSPVCVSVCVFVLFGLVSRCNTLAARQCAPSWSRGEPCGRAAVGPLDEMGLMDEVVYTSKSCSALESLWQHRFNSSRLAYGCGWHHPVNLW